MSGVDVERAIRLEPITRENWLTAIALRVRPDQEAFVPSVAVSLAKVAVRLGCAHTPRGAHTQAEPDTTPQDRTTMANAVFMRCSNVASA